MRTLPDFQRPPLVEVVLGVQFDPIGALRSPHLGLLWQRYRDSLPKLEERLPLESAVERFGVQNQPKPRLRVSEEPGVNRAWFLNDTGTQLVQVQRDRFIHNWRKQQDDDPYPRYETIVELFMSELRQFEAFLSEEKLGGPIRVNQCEVTYVNILAPVSGAWEGHEDVGKLFGFLALPTCEHLGAPEDISLLMRHIIPGIDGRPTGRLQISLAPVFIGEEESEGYRLQLTARGQPASEAIEGAKQFLDLGREWIVNGFTCITTPEMHRIWGRLQ